MILFLLLICGHTLKTLTFIKLNFELFRMNFQKQGAKMWINILIFLK